MSAPIVSPGVLNPAGDTKGSGLYPWYAIRVRSNFEFRSSSSLVSKGYEVFLPTCLARKQRADRIVNLQVPLFDGYFFCRLNALQRMPILVTPGVVHIVGSGKVPEPIPEEEVVAVRTMIESGLNAQPWPFLKTGDTVRMVSGPLAGLEGILVSSKNKHRLVVSVMLLQRSVAAEVDSAWLELIRRAPAKATKR